MTFKGIFPWLCCPCHLILPSPDLNLLTCCCWCWWKQEIPQKSDRYLYILFCSVLFYLVIWHWTVEKALACNDCSTCTVNCWAKKKKRACLCCRFGHTTDGRETAVDTGREAVYCRWGGELEDGGPVFIYKYPYFCVLACTLCRNWLEQRCVF